LWVMSHHFNARVKVGCKVLIEKDEKRYICTRKYKLVSHGHIIRSGIQIVFRCHEEYELETWTDIGFRSRNDYSNHVLCCTLTRHIQSNNCISQRECSQKYRRSNPEHRIIGIGFSGILFVPEAATLRKGILTSVLESSDGDVFTNSSLCI